MAGGNSMLRASIFVITVLLIHLTISENLSKASFRPHNLIANAIGPTEIGFSWSPPIDTGAISHYTLLYNSTDPAGAYQAELGPHAMWFSLNDLIPDTVYVARLSVVGEDGEEGTSRLVQARTPPHIPAEPRRVTYIALNSTTVVVSWNPPRDRRFIKGYYVYYKKITEGGEPASGPEVVINVDYWNVREADIYGLDAKATYSVSVAAKTRKGDGIRSKPIIVSTVGQVATEPRNVIAELIQPDPPIARVSWNKPATTHGELLGYKVLWGPLGEKHQQEHLSPSDYSFTTSPLQTDTHYQFYVFAKNNASYGSRAVATLHTPNVVAAFTPVNVAVLSVSKSSVIVTWDQPPSNDVINDDIVKSYRIFYNRMRDLDSKQPVVVNTTLNVDMSTWDIIDTDGPRTLHQITDLEPDQHYVVRVQAVTMTGALSNHSHVVLAVTRSAHLDRNAVQNLKARGTTSSKILVSWDRPLTHSPVSVYKMFYQRIASGHQERNDTMVDFVKIVQLHRSRSLDTIRDLAPYSRYMINVTAYFLDDAPSGTVTTMAETDIAAPELVPAPWVFGVVDGNIEVSLEAASEADGPLASYMLVVVPSQFWSKAPDQFTLEELMNDSVPPGRPAMTPYIAGSFHPRRLSTLFYVGDGRRVGRYENRPLDPYTEYRVYLRANTVNQELYKCSDFSEPFSLSSVVRITTNMPTSTVPEPTVPETTTQQLPEYDCRDRGVEGHSCDDILSFFASKKAMCKKVFHECCATCSDKSVCKRDKRKVAKKHVCSGLVQELGHVTACTIFTRDCCKTCQTSLKTGGS